MRAVTVIALLAALLAGCGGQDEQPAAPRPAYLEMPASLGAVCQRIAAESKLPVLCPRESRGGGTVAVVHEDLDPDPCAYVVNLETPLARRRGERPFHVMFGGRCTPLPLEDEDGVWPPAPPESLRLAGGPPLQSGQAPRISRPKVVGRVEVRGHPGLLLQAMPFPEGGFPGGHASLVWNEGGHGYMASVHVPAGDTGRPPDRTVVRALGELARGMGRS